MIISDQSILSWQRGSSTFRAAPTCGARLCDWRISVAGSRPRSVIHWPEGDLSAIPAGQIRGGNPLLFPFASRSYAGEKEYHWKTSDDTVLPMPQHGFARDLPFQLIHHDEKGFRARLQPDEIARTIYPFAYDFEVEYQFEELGLRVTMELRNRDERPIPWSAGHHFYFTLPWHTGANRANYQFLVNARRTARFSDEGKIIREPVNRQPLRFSDPRLINLLHYELRDNRACFGPLSGEEPVLVQFGSHPDVRPAPHNTIVTWTKGDAEPYYCVEPWMGLPNAVAHGKGLHWVSPGDGDTFEVQLRLD